VPDVNVAVHWSAAAAEMRGGRVGGPEIAIDSSGAAGTSPPVMLVTALAGCMAVDVIDIAEKMRLPITGLRVEVEGDRRADPPRRFTALRQRFIVSGARAGDEPKIQRAIDLSREKYCSVLHSLREDIEMTFELELT
jgi:putative redox protein